MNETASAVGAVAIGRNEGERLRRCLLQLVRQCEIIVYVDSGSNDGSVDVAKSLGVHVVELDTRKPFNAARARNAGWLEIERLNPQVQFLQFVDGDCELVDRWIQTGLRSLANDPKLAVVCGRRRERFPSASLYNRLMDLEWNTPIGPTESCGGDSLVRMEAIREVGGFDETVSAGEEPELCKRLRSSGWRIERIDAEMTLHDAAMSRFSQWWRRQRRSGHGALDVTQRYGVNGFQRELRSARLWTMGWLGITLTIAFVASAAWGWLGFLGGLALGIAIYAAQLLKLTLRGIRQGFSPGQALVSSCIMMFGKFASMHGQILWLLDRMRGGESRQIEYKGSEMTRTAQSSK